MIAPGRWKREVLLATVAVMLSAVAMAGVARADVAFRKKKAPETDTTGSAAAPAGSELEGQSGATEPAATDGEEAPPPPKVEYAPQMDDKDRPRDPSLLDQKTVDAALAEKQKEKEREREGPPLYQKWQFWAIVGGVVIGAVAAVWGGTKLAHELNGGDVRACNPALVGCYGEGH